MRAVPAQEVGAKGKSREEPQGWGVDHKDIGNMPKPTEICPAPSPTTVGADDPVFHPGEELPTGVPDGQLSDFEQTKTFPEEEEAVAAAR